RAAEHLFEPLLVAEVAQPLPTQIAAIEKARLITQPFKDGCRVGGLALLDRRLEIDVDPRVRQTRDERRQTGHGAVPGGEKSVRGDPSSPQGRQPFTGA